MTKMPGMAKISGQLLFPQIPASNNSTLLTVTLELPPSFMLV
jgi:hypothetical protein